MLAVVGVLAQQTNDHHSSWPEKYLGCSANRRYRVVLVKPLLVLVPGLLVIGVLSIWFYRVLPSMIAASPRLGQRTDSERLRALRLITVAGSVGGGLAVVLISLATVIRSPDYALIAMGILAVTGLSLMIGVSVATRERRQSGH